jgi:nucleoside-diphosphate-sugar epimerase/glyoxylase-like metal-dependent hydrolase (beta-lactamase superfamily II)
VNGFDFTSPARNALQAQTVLVTGATGFLGGHLVRKLISEKIPVRAIGRNLEKGLELQSIGADFLPVDLRDRASVITACKGVSIVVHAGALSSAWGKYKDFFDINVVGTQNIIDGCLEQNVARLIYISSPSVMSIHGEQLALDETHPLPESFVSIYSETKALAEKRVENAAAKGLATVILRPKAIYGPGDQAIFPRIIERLEKGRLPVFGDGSTMTNVTHVTDVVQSIQLAMHSDAAVGKTYLITGDEDVRLLDAVNLVADRLGLSRPSRKIPKNRALQIGAIMESVWNTLPLSGEPPLTRYKASIFAHSQTYDITAAKRDLGYAPEIQWQEGIEDFVERLNKNEEPEIASTKPNVEKPSEPVTATLEILRAGQTEARERIFGLSSSLKPVMIPALFARIDHPVHGTILFDTGYSTHFAEATQTLPDKAYSWVTPVKITPEENASAQLEAKGVAPSQVKWIVLSHFDPDHIGGLRDFPESRIICSKNAYADTVGKSGLKAVAGRLLTGLLPEDFSARVLLLSDAEGPAIGPFEHSTDLFGDGSVVIVELPGHASGMIGAFVQTSDQGRVFLCADACWTRKQIAQKGHDGVHRLLAKDKGAQEQVYERLRLLATQMPDVKLLPSHCPAAAEEFVNSTVE